MIAPLDVIAWSPGRLSTFGVGRSALCAALLLLAAAHSAAADADGTRQELAALRAEMDLLRRDYEARTAALQIRLSAAEAQLTEMSSSSPASQTAVAALEPAARAPAYRSGSDAFNPAIGLNLQGLFSRYIDGPSARTLAGFQTNESAGRDPEGLGLRESELSFSANVDDQYFAFANVAFSVENGESAVDVEEVYLQTTALGNGLTARAGQFFSGIGYQNAKHSHAWDFVDQPLAYTGMLGGQYLDPGVQLVWLAPTDLYLQLGAEIFRGDQFPASGAHRDGVGASSVFANVGGDIGEANAWQAGLSYLAARPHQRNAEDAGGQLTSFSGDSDLWLADVVWKWAPEGNRRGQNLVLQSEWLHRRERGSLLVGGQPERGQYRGTQDGWYVQSVYQFMPRWRTGVRYDRLWSDNTVQGLSVPTVLDDDERHPQRLSFMLDFSNSEFSRWRLQYNLDDSERSATGELYMQYIMSIGAHGAHTF